MLELTPKSAPESAPESVKEDELVAITVAVQSYIASIEAESMALRYTLDREADTASSGSAIKNMSPWAVAGRLAASRHDATRVNRPIGWRNFCGALLFTAGLATTLSISQITVGAPPVLAQSAGLSTTGDLASTATSAQAFYGSWSFADKSQNIKVLIGAPSQKIDLDLPDGGSIYSADGALVARVGPRSSWTLNLASAAVGSGSAVSQNPATGMSQIVARKKIVFTGKGALDLAQTAVSNQDIAASSQRQDYQKAAFTPSGGANFVESRFALPPDAANGGYLVVPEADSSKGAPPIVGVGGKLYRGCLLLRPFTPAVATNADAGSINGSTNISIAVINVLKVEDYLLSVVPSEVPASWPQEVLKAQAITARSYAFANLGKHKADGYDVKDTVEDQVYKGVMTENNNTNTACANTAGLVLKQNDQVISAFFHSTSGGMTELAENVWSKPLPYLKSVPDYDDASPYFSWQRSFTVAQLNKVLLGGDGAGCEQLTGLFVVGRYKSDAQRVRNVVATSTGAGRVLTGAEIRKLLNLPSTQFSLYQADGAYVFSGHGFGHGLGLSQWGAKALADRGYNAGQILSYYYKDVTIDQIGSSGGFNGPNGSI